MLLPLRIGSYRDRNNRGVGRGRRGGRIEARKGRKSEWHAEGKEELLRLERLGKEGLENLAEAFDGIGMSVISTPIQSVVIEHFCSLMYCKNELGREPLWDIQSPLADLKSN